MDSIFTKHDALFMRDPAGGVEDVQAMKNGGFGAIFLNVQKEINSAQWDLVRQRAALAQVEVFPWCYIWNLYDLDRLIAIADQWGTKPVVNVEKQLDEGVFTTQQIADKLGNRDAAFSTECWLYGNVDWSPISQWPVMLQIFPLEVPSAAHWEDCKIHAHDCGFECVMYTFGTYDVNGVQPQPSDYPLLSPYQLYTADDLTYIYPDYFEWGPMGELDPCMKQKKPISEFACPYTGPYYHIGSKFKPTRGKTVKALKIAMERLKMGKFPNPSMYFGSQLATALRKFQIKSNISPVTGHYGRRTWSALRAATLPDGSYALTVECLKLILEDAANEK